MAQPIYAVEHPERVVRSQSQLPCRTDGTGPFKRFSVSTLYIRFKPQLALDAVKDQRPMHALNGREVSDRTRVI